ncbi:unnamed protein product, partial [Amoebophrya sp. A25]
DWHYVFEHASWIRRWRLDTSQRTSFRPRHHSSEWRSRLFPGFDRWSGSSWGIFFRCLWWYGPSWHTRFRSDESGSCTNTRRSTSSSNWRPKRYFRQLLRGPIGRGTESWQTEECRISRDDREWKTKITKTPKGRGARRWKYAS